jgi:predicted cupin superfamily sugar epimerase
MKGENMISAEEIIQLLGMKPHLEEGGYFVELYRSGDVIPKKALPDRYGYKRSFGTAIFYLLTPDTFSALHRLESSISTWATRPPCSSSGPMAPPWC